MPAARLPTVANAQRQKIATPVKIRPDQLTVSGMQLAEPGKPGKQVSGAPNTF